LAVRKRRWRTRNGDVKEAWVVDYTDQDGDRHIETFKRKKDADARAQQIGVDVRAGIHTAAAKSVTVTEAAADWIRKVELDERERSTIAQYRQHARHITARIGNQKLAKLTKPRVEAFRDDLLASMSRALARKVLSSLKSLLRDAQRRGNVAQNVAADVRIGVDKRGKKKLKAGVDIPTPDEIKRLLGTVSGRLRPLLITATFTGLRASELRGLRWQDIDLQRNELHVRQRADRYNKIGKLKSASAQRTIPFGPLVRNTLREWKLEYPRPMVEGHDIGEPHKPEHYVFPNQSGEVEHYSSLVRALQSAIIEAGLTALATDKDGKPLMDESGNPVVAAKYSGPHALRHFYASWCINSRQDGGLELPPKVVQARLGHASIVMTLDTYGHLHAPMMVPSWRLRKRLCCREWVNA
jgi:integrase